MINVNFKPVLSGPDFLNQIVLTDNSYSDQSVVYMDRSAAPARNTLAWVTIADPMGGYMLKRWMYVDHVLFEDYTDPIVRDESGDPVLDENDMPIRKSLKSMPGYCRVILREHKHVFTRSTFLDSFNIPSLLSFVLKEYSQIEKFNSLNELDWDGIENLFSHRGVKLHVPERPPFVPVNLYYRGLHLADGLDDLLFHLSCRCIESPVSNDVTRQDFSTVDHNDPETLTNLVWKKRRFVDLPDDIIYDKILWPDESELTRFEQENTNRVLFTTLSNRDFERLEILSPAGRPLRCNKVIGGGDRTLIRKWLNETYINVDLFYAFTTHRLPISFLQDHDWSKITYSFGHDNYEILVEHNPRQTNRLEIFHQTERKETFSGRVTSASPGSATLTDLKNESSPHRELLLDVAYTIPLTNFTPPSDIVGKRLEFQIENNTVSLLSSSSLYNPLDDFVQIMPLHNGDEVTQIVQTIDGLEYECPATSISFGSDPVFDYQFKSYEVNPAYEGSENTLVWNLIDNDPDAFNVTLANPNKVIPTVRVTFEMSASREDIIAYLTDQFEAGSIGEDYIEALADFWELTFKEIDILFSFSRSPMQVAWRPYYGQGYVPGFDAGFLGTPGYYSNIRPDIDSELFTGPRGISLGPSQSFPLTFPDPGVRKTGTFSYLNFVGNTPGWDYDTLRQELSTRYISNHLELFPVIISLTLAST